MRFEKVFLKLHKPKNLFVDFARFLKIMNFAIEVKVFMKMRLLLRFCILHQG